jgi:uncharacterized protein
MIISNPNLPEKILKKTEKKTDTKSKVDDSEKVENQSFLNILESIVPSTQAETKEMNVLWRQLPDAEKEFLKTPNNINLQKYKNLVKEITTLILKNNTEIVQARRRGRNDKKILLTVKIIDENLQLLATTMLSPANSAFSLLKQIEKIRGLLMDIKE